MDNNLGFVYIDDDYMSRMVVEMLLTRMLNFRNVAIFEDTADILKRLIQLPFIPDLIMLDIHMGPLNGFDVLELLQNHPRFQHSKVVAVTASVMNEEVSTLKEAGFHGALGKPVDQTYAAGFIEGILRGERIWHVV